MIQQLNEEALLQAKASITSDVKKYLHIFLEDQVFGIDILTIQEVLFTPVITEVPLARSNIAGLMNLRGRIVTAVDLGGCLGLTPSRDSQESMSIVVDDDGERYSLIIDRVGEVSTSPLSEKKPTPPHISPLWSRFSDGVIKFDQQLMVVLDVPSIFRFFKQENQD